MHRLLVLIALLGCFVSAFGQDNFPDVTESHAGYKAFLRLRMSSGFIVGYDERFRVAPTAAEMANALIKSVEAMPEKLAAALDAVKVAGRNLRYEEVEFFSHELIQDFRVAIDSVRKEIKARGVDPDKLLTRLEANRKVTQQIVDLLLAKRPKPFRDVPVSHWAWRATQELRDAGILVGYPDGTFRG